MIGYCRVGNDIEDLQDELGLEYNDWRGWNVLHYVVSSQNSDMVVNMSILGTPAFFE